MGCGSSKSSTGVDDNAHAKPSSNSSSPAKQASPAKVDKKLILGDLADIVSSLKESKPWEYSNALQKVKLPSGPSDLDDLIWKEKRKLMPSKDAIDKIDERVLSVCI